MSTKRSQSAVIKLDKLETDESAHDEMPVSNVVSIQAQKPGCKSYESCDADVESVDDRGDISIQNKKKPFPTSALGCLEEVTQIISASVQVAPEMVAGILIALLSAILQTFFNVSIRSSGDGMPLSLNMFLIADSGERKSSTVQAVAKPLYMAIRKFVDQRRHMLIQDISLDGLAVGLISRCPSQLLLVLEAATLFSGHAMNKENLMRFLGIISSLFSGEAISRTRVGEHHYAEGRRLNALVMSQGIVAMEFLGSDMVMQQGLGYRFLYDKPESMRGLRPFVDRELDSDPEYELYCEYVCDMASRVMEIDEATGGVNVKVIRPGPDAKSIWIDHYNALESGCREGGVFATHAGYVTRFPEQTLPLAGILTLVEDIDAPEITADAMSRAVMLADYYLHSAIQLFTKAPADIDELQAQVLLNWMREKQVELELSAIPVRLIYKDGPRSARRSKRARELLEILESRGEVAQYDKTIVYGGEDKKRSNQNYRVVAP